MLYLGEDYGLFGEYRKYAHLLWQSTHHPIYLSVEHPGMFFPASYYGFATNRSAAGVTHDEMNDICSAMQAARQAFLRNFDMILMTCSCEDFRSVLGRSDESFPEWVWRDSSEIAKAVYQEVKSGRLIFVPKHEDLRACVKTIQEDRLKPLPQGELQGAQSPNPYATVRQMMGKPPRIPQNLVTPTSFADAQPFEYQPDMPDCDVIDLAKTPNDGEPGTWYTNSGSGQMRLYGNDGKPVVDFDFDHDHGQGVPHAHNWHINPLTGKNDRGSGVPFSILP